MSKQEEVYNKICSWESEAGECFNDRFSYDTIANQDWGEFLMKEGLVERGHNVIKESLTEQSPFSEHTELYEIKPYYNEETGDRLDEEMDNYHYNMMLVAKFIAGNKDYLNAFNEFINLK